MKPSVQPGTAAQLTLAASIIVGGYFLAVDASEYLRNFTAEVYGRFWPKRNPMFLHIAAGALALVAGAVQFALVFLRRMSTVHRWMGRMYVGAVLVSCLASLIVLRNGSVIGPIWTSLLVILAVCATVFTAKGWIAARRRQWQLHAAWMLRSYLAMMVFAWFRLIWELPVLEAMAPGARAALILGLTMLFTGIVSEAILALRGRQQPSMSPHVSTGHR
jgi:hypothetical protein